MTSSWKGESLVVLDACSLIAFFNDEKGADLVAAMLEEVASVEMSVVNLVEIAYDAVRNTGSPDSAFEVLEAVRQLPIKIHWEIDERICVLAAEFKAAWRISLADAFALALAKSLGAPLVTSDHHEFDSLEQAGASRFIWIR